MGLVLSGIGKSFGTPPTQVLHSVSLEIADGEMVALTGRSGSGKSTLLYIVSTLDTPSEGSVVIDGHATNRMTQHEVHKFRNLSAGFVFQFHHLLPELTALENVLMPAIKTRQADKFRPRAAALLSEFGLGDKLGRLPSQLSGGEQQRVAIARALVMEPKYIFADEPTGNLDSINGEIVMNLLSRINRERGTTIIYVTHDEAFAQLAKRSIRLVDGRVS